MSFHLRVEKDEVSGETGIRTFWVRVVEKDDDGNVVDQGPVVGHSIGEASLEKRFNGKYREFLESVKAKRVRHHKEVRKSQRDEVKSLAGQDL